METDTPLGNNCLPLFINYFHNFYGQNFKVKPRDRSGSVFLLASSSSNLHLALEHFVAEREVPGTRISTLTSETMVLIWKRLELLPQVEEFKWVKFKYLSITLFTRGKTGWEMDRCLQWHGCCNSKESWRKTKLLFYWASYIPILTYCVPLTSSVGWFFLLKERVFFLPTVVKCLVIGVSSDFWGFLWIIVESLPYNI